MKPEVVEQWNRALRSYEKAKAAYGDHQRTNDVKDELFDAVLFGYGAVVESRKTGDETHCVFGDWHATEHLWSPSVDSREAIEETFKTLSGYREQIPDDLEPPQPLN